jgi:hypothetical protein
MARWGLGFMGGISRLRARSSEEAKEEELADLI